MYSVFLAPHVAAGDAVAAIDARLLLDAMRIVAVDGEIHRRCPAPGPCMPSSCARRFSACTLASSSARGCGFAASTCVRSLVVRQQRVVGDRRRPAELLEDFAVGHDRHVGVDQRRAAQSRALDHRDVGVVQQFVEAQRIGDRCASRRCTSRQRLRKVAGLPLLAALQNTDGRLADSVRPQPGAPPRWRRRSPTRS